MNTKTVKIIYWITTILIFLFEGVMPALTSHTDLAKEGVRHLGYPDYFLVLLTVFKVIGSLVLIIPFFKGRYKEWAYAGLGLTMISACVSHWVIDGFGAETIMPIVVFGVLALSHVMYTKLHPAHAH